MNNELIVELEIEAEGFRSRKYKCSKGIDTIGYGRTFLSKGECMVLSVQSFEELESITESMARWLLDADIKRCILELQTKLQYFAILPSDIQVVLIDMCFNMGIDRLMKFKKMFRYIQQGDYSKASIELLDSNYCSDVKGRALRNSIAMSSGKFLDLELCKKMWKQLKGRV